MTEDVSANGDPGFPVACLRDPAASAILSSA